MAVVLVTLDQIKGMITEGLAGSQAKLQEAESLLFQMLNKQPDNWPALFLLSGIYLNAERHGVGISLLHRINELQPGIPEVYNNLGTAYRKEHMNDLAEEWLLKAAALKEDADVFNNLGTLHINEGSPEKAVEYLEKAIALEPQNKHAHWNIGLALLEMEQWKRGFEEYSWGLTTKDRMTKDYGTARWWDGKPHADKTLVIYGEQGIGDELMFGTAIHDAMKRFEGRIILDCHPRLVGLFKRAFPDVTIYPTRKLMKQEPEWLSDEKPDFKVPIGNLFRFFRQDEVDFPKLGYLTADKERVDDYKRWFAALGDKPVVGISWVGGHKKTRKDVRAVNIDALLPIFKANPDVTWVSMQYTDHGDTDTARLLEEHGIKVHHFSEVVESSRWERWKLQKGDEVLAVFDSKETGKSYLKKQLNADELKLVHVPGCGYDYDETAAFVQAIDETGGTIVTVNTSLVHLCGCMDIDCMTLTPNKPAWRYGMSRRDMVMYGSITQYRQDAEGDWSPAISEVAKDLGEYLNEHECSQVSHG